MITPVRRIAVLAMVVVLAACGSPPKRSFHRPPAPSPSPAASSSGGPVPAWLLNPDVTQASIDKTICVSGWTDTVRPPSSYTTGLKRQQLPAGADLSAYEEDHWIPLELGGNPREPRNLWPEPIADARRKDALETQAHRDVCAGRETLADARQAMYDGWRH